MSPPIQNQHYGATPETFGKAKKLRKNNTSAESLLWEFLRNRKLAGYKFRRQHPIGIYVADFYCPEKRLVVELDGMHHLNKEEKQSDDERTFTFSLDGIKVLRFLNDDVQHDLPSVLKKIEETLRG